MSMIIIDNFYRNPIAVRNFASKAQYNGAAEIDNFPGSQSPLPFFNQEIVKKFESIIGGDIQIDLDRNLFGQFRLSLANSPRNTIVHLDDTQWAAVIYLTLDTHCQGGTNIFRHIESGISCVTSQSMQSIGMTRPQFEREIVMRDSLDVSKWEKIQSCDMKFNRLVLMEGSKFLHGADQTFGHSFDDGRLTQHFFFDRK